ncbi:helix-turn-helix domain-containing protein, partial [Streptomyces niveus]|uniref:helix-turn-helix domain-containing protein n=1 Tax=Streptomyces niveus TaxID=193462 RepID=UPI0034466EC5
ARVAARHLPLRNSHGYFSCFLSAPGSEWYPAGPHSLESLAVAVGVSARHLSRLFRSETGTTTGQYVESVRLEAAQVLLESGDDSVDTVAEASGFGSSETMRRVFQHALGIAPTAYRARFRTTTPHRVA